MSLQVANHARALPGYPFDVRTLRSNSDNNHFWWMARDVYGKIIETSSTTYKTETEARAPRMQLPELFVDGFSTPWTCA